MSKLLEQAIADAKAVKAVALANAKAALEEAFRGPVEAMLAEKLKEEAEMEAITGSEPTDTSKNTDENMEEVSDAELEEILAELSSDLSEENESPESVPAAETPVPAVSDVAAPVAPAPVAPAPTAPVAPMAAEPMASAPEVPTVPAPVTEEDMEEVDLNELLNSLNEEVEEVQEAKASEEKEKEDDEEGKGEEENVKESSHSEEEGVSKECYEEVVKERDDAISAINHYKKQLDEVNLLNAKLLYTNKLFKQYPLTNEQKMKIVETFDLTQTVREVKIAYTSLAESFNFGKSTVKKTNTVASTITEGLASKTVASTKPPQSVIVENTNTQALRFQTLAGIKKV